MNIQENQSTACILCSRNCGLTVTLEDRTLKKIKGDKGHPMTKGYICQKAAKLDFYQNNEDRLDTPLKRNDDGELVSISWDQAISEIAQKMSRVRDTHGADSFALVGGGGQGNHIGGVYAQQLRSAMGGSRYVYPALAQEKTMDFWINGRLFGDQRVHCTEDVEHSDYILFIGCNPFQAHGIPNARDTLKEIKKDPNRCMVVVDPRVSETAKVADVHLQVVPGTDAYLMLAILAIIVREGLHDTQFLKAHTTGFSEFQKYLDDIPVDEYLEKSGISYSDAKKVARGFAMADSACVRIDLGLQQSLHSTITAYLEKMLYLITGNFAKKGGNNLHTSFLPLLGNTDERYCDPKRTAHHGMIPISGMYPPNILPDEIMHEDGIKAVWVDSSNPVMTFADSKAFERAFEELELLVVVDVALTETGRLADYVLPASSQYEKWEATGFNAEFPENFFHLRKPVLAPKEGTLPEPEIYTRLLEKMNVIPQRYSVLRNIARFEPDATMHQAYLSALMMTLKKNKELAPYAASVMYRTLGPSLPDGAGAAAFMLPLAIDYARKHRSAVKRAGIEGNKVTLGAHLFRQILRSHSGTIISKHEMSDQWKFIRNSDGRIHLGVEEVFSEIEALRSFRSSKEEYPYILMAGERRSYNANQIYRNPEWRKTDKDGALRIHPKDAEVVGVTPGSKVTCISKNGEIEVTVEIDGLLRPGMVTLPHGYGMKYKGGERVGPALNMLTSGDHCDPFTKTPFHKYVPVKLEKVCSS